MKPSSRDHQLGLASPLNYVANQSGNIKSPSKKEAGLDVSHQALVSREGRGENFFLDIPFHRMSAKSWFRQLPTSSDRGTTRSKQRWREDGSTILPVFKVKKEISDKCRPKERGDAAFTIKRWKRSI
jgi:hypothetical protein